MILIDSNYINNILKCTFDLDEEEGDSINGELILRYKCNLIRDEYMVPDQYHGSYIEFGNNYSIEDVELLTVKLIKLDETIKVKTLAELNVAISEEKIDSIVAEIIENITVDSEDE